MKQVVIVGAGIAGLTAGIYARQSGFDVTIYESHTIPGGASTSWRRNGYLFEGGIHWLTGSSPRTEFNTLWREVGALDDSVKIIDSDPFFTLEHKGETVHLYRDIDKLKQHLLEVSPQDAPEITRLCRDVRRFMKFQMPLTDIKGVKVKQKSSVPLSTMLEVLPALPRLSYYSKLTSEEYSLLFKNEAIRLMLQNVAGSENCAVALVFTLATLAFGDGGYPEGGSLPMTARMAQKFLALGGAIQYGKFVDRVAVEKGTATGIMVEGEYLPADAVIVTQDTRCAIDTLFDLPIQDSWANRMRETTVPMLDTFICLGVTVDLSDLPHGLNFSLDETLHCGNVPIDLVGINNYATFEGYAPKGCTALTTILTGDSYDFWKQCKEDGTYEEEKRKLAEAYIRVVSEKIPRIAGNVVVWDVATPLTYERYLHSFKGSWMTEMGARDANREYPSQPEHIKNVYFAGQRLMKPGGLPVAAETGRKAVQHLCRDTDSVFQGAV